MSPDPRFIACYELSSTATEETETNITPISRITRGADGKAVPLPLDKLAMIDGQKFGLSGEGIGDEPATDKEVFLTRVTAGKRVPRLAQRSLAACRFPGDRVVKVALPNKKTIQIAIPDAPPAGAIYLGGGYAALFLGGKSPTAVPVTMDITFRSPDGLFRYLGAYLAQNDAAKLKIDDKLLFSIADGRVPDALARANYRGKNYSLVNDPKTGIRNAEIFTLLQQLINIHKEASERPTTIPVRAIP